MSEIPNASLSIPLRVGDYIFLYTNVDVDDEMSVCADILFEGTVSQYVTETGLLRFEENNVGLAEFEALLEEAEAHERIAREVICNE